MKKKSLTQERLRSVLHYDETTGVFKRLIGGSGKGASVGAIAGCDNGQGYIVISIDGETYRAHRLAFLYMTGEWPKHEVDHVNGVRADNRWENLRDVTNKDNTHNQRSPHRQGRTGYLGVRFCRNKFAAVIGVNGQRRHIGVYSTAEEAHQAYIAAKRQFHPSCTL